MACQFDGTNYLTVTLSSGLDVPLTVLGWWYKPTYAGTETIFSLNATGLVNNDFRVDSVLNPPNYNIVAKQSQTGNPADHKSAVSANISLCGRVHQSDAPVHRSCGGLGGREHDGRRGCAE